MERKQRRNGKGLPRMVGRWRKSSEIRCWMWEMNWYTEFYPLRFQYIKLCPICPSCDSESGWKTTQWDCKILDQSKGGLSTVVNGSDGNLSCPPDMYWESCGGCYCEEDKVGSVTDFETHQLPTMNNVWQTILKHYLSAYWVIPPL